MSVWEIRHGSVMALREILTHHGASAGVFMPDLNSIGEMCLDFDDHSSSSTVKRERQIDLNMQVLVDEPEPNPKRLKSEDVSCSSMGIIHTTESSGLFDVYTKVEEGGWGLPAEQVNGKLDTSFLKVEPYTDSTQHLVKETVTGTKQEDQCQDEGLNENSNMDKCLSENPELTNLVKLARHCWLKNSEFLQDCAIRFLCILSLDRYASSSFLSH